MVGYLLIILVFSIFINRCSFIKINTSLICNYEKYYGRYGLMKYKNLGYNDIFPDAIVNKSNVKKFITKTDLFGDEQIGYLVISSI